MTPAAADPDCPAGPSEALCRLRRMRAGQAWTLAAVSVGSIAAGVAMIRHDGGPAAVAFLGAVGWQFVIWGAIDLVFAGFGIAQSIKANRTPPVPQAEADEFLAAEKLLRSLRFNHRLNVAYLVTAAGLLVWAAAVHSAALAGHGVGVLLQGGFLFCFDLIYVRRFTRLMTAPVA